MKKIVLAIILIISAPVVFAGASSYYQVTVNLSSGYAFGSMVGARNSRDTVQWIGCTRSFRSHANANCTARNAAGVYGACSTTDLGLIEALSPLADESYLVFGWNSSGTCTYIAVYNHSKYKNPS